MSCDSQTTNGVTAHISVRDLSVWYGKRPVLKNVSVDIPAKQISIIIGPSGCGKTTLLKSFNRLLEIQEGVKVEGTVYVDGENIYRPGIELIALRKRMGLLLQRPQLLPMSIYENVAFGPRLHGIRNRRRLDQIVEERLRECHLWEEVADRLEAPAGKLSIGQQQRLCLARGLAVEPEIILADEPTSALDPVSSQNIEQRFLELKQRYTVVIVTHILRQARRLADYVLFLYMGQLIEHGAALKIFNEPAEAMTREYVKGVIS